MTGLEAEHLELGYAADIPAIVQGLSLTLEPGAFMGVVGPNGSGKSTLVRGLSRVLKPRGGAVLLDGRDLYKSIGARQSAQSIGTVPQSTSIAFDFTVREVVEMGRAPHRSAFGHLGAGNRENRKSSEIVDEAMRRADVIDLTDRVASQLSGGEQQRVLLARALAQEPRILLLDEPTSHLDLHHQTAVLRLVRQLTVDDGLSTLAVLHDLNLAASYCDRLLLMARGRVIARGSVVDVLTEANVHEAYGARVWVRCHPVSGRPYVLTLPDVPHDVQIGAPVTDAVVHVVCGAGTGAGLMFRLRQLGYTVSAGGLNAGDTDQEAAELLGIDYAREAPFTAFSADAASKAEALAMAASIIVITDVPFGKGNLANLEAALAACRSGNSVVALSPDGLPFDKRDFTGGDGARLWNELRAAGMREAADIESVIDAVTSLTSNASA